MPPSSPGGGLQYTVSYKPLLLSYFRWDLGLFILANVQYVQVVIFLMTLVFSYLML